MTVKRRPTIPHSQLARFAAISKASWVELYRDLYHQCYGGDESTGLETDTEWLDDAEHRLIILRDPSLCTGARGATVMSTSKRVTQIVETATVVAAESGRALDLKLTNTVRLLYRHATSLRRWYTEDLNRPLTESDRKRITQLEARVTALVSGLGLTCGFQDDPRGPSVRINTPTTHRYNTWAIDGWYIGGD